MKIRHLNGRYKVQHYETINGCCGANYVNCQLTEHQPFNGIAVSDTNIGNINEVSPTIVNTKNGPLYVYVVKGTTP